MRSPLPVVCLALVVSACAKQTADAGDARASASATPSTTASSVVAAAAGPCVVTLTGKTAESFGKPALEYVMKNAGDRAFNECSIRIYAYDASGAQISYSIMSTWVMFDALAPGATRTSKGGVFDASGHTLVGTANATFEIVADGVKFADGSSWSDNSLTPMHRPRGGVKK
jgi:hypothetical protein